MPTSGIRGTHDIPLGSHLCMFYRQPTELLQRPAAFMSAGLAEDELRLWILPVPLTIPLALDELSTHGLNGPVMLAAEQLHISSAKDWYGDSAFDVDHSLARLAALPPRARQLGYVSVRAAGGPGGAIYVYRISPGLYALRTPSHDTHCCISNDRPVLLCLNPEPRNRHVRHHEGPSSGFASHARWVGQHLRKKHRLYSFIFSVSYLPLCRQPRRVAIAGQFRNFFSDFSSERIHNMRELFKGITPRAPCRGSTIPGSLVGGAGPLFHGQGWRGLCQDGVHERDQAVPLERLGQKRERSPLDPMTGQFLIRIS